MQNSSPCSQPRALEGFHNAFKIVFQPKEPTAILVLFPMATLVDRNMLLKPSRPAKILVCHATPPWKNMNSHPPHLSPRKSQGLSLRVLPPQRKLPSALTQHKVRLLDSPTWNPGCLQSLAQLQP